jgi:hypothetical protein
MNQDPLTSSLFQSLMLRFALVMIRGLVTMANSSLSKGAVREILDLTRDLNEAVYGNLTRPEGYK